MILLERKKLKGVVVDREKKILELCKRRSVLHLGCADHPFGKEQYQKGILLHQKIADVTNDLMGIDLSTEGIAWLTSVGYKNLLVGNAEKLSELGIKCKFDVIVAGELLEHLSNPGMFLSSVHPLMAQGGVLIITVPNAHAVKSFIRILFLRKELVHPDHFYYFSVATIEHICKRYNYELLEYFYYLSNPNGISKKLIFLPIKYFIKFISPYMGDGLIFIIKSLKNA